MPLLKVILLDYFLIIFGICQQDLNRAETVLQINSTYRSESDNMSINSEEDKNSAKLINGEDDKTQTFVNSEMKSQLLDETRFKCGRNEIFIPCPRYCQRTCSNPEKKLCISYSGCEPSCVCREGFVRSANWICIRLELCPVKKINSCGANQHWSDCGTKCPLTCENYKKQLYCGEDCVRGCFCNYGYVREVNGGCIRRTQCLDCPKNEFFNPRGSPCPPNTNNLLPECPGAKPVPNCYCNKGFIRGATSKVCVPFEVNDIAAVTLATHPTLPPLETLQNVFTKIRCPQNQTFSKCGKDCGQQCSDFDKNTICKNTCKRGCFCSPEFVRDQITGRCVLPNDCTLDEASDSETIITDESDENFETTVITEYDSYETSTTTTAKTYYIVKCPNGMKFFKCSDCSKACQIIERRHYARDKRSVYSHQRANIQLNGKCLYPYQCDSTTDKITYEVERFN